MLAEYFYLVDQVLAMVRPGEVAYYYHNDHLGTPQILTNDTGTVAWKAFYKPFGEAVISISTIENPFRFPGQYYDPEAGLHYNWNRYYDPKTGRYLTPDPIGLDGGINLFRYVHNNPLKLIDLDGLIEKAIYDNLVNWLKGFLGWANYYQAVQMANDAIKQLDAIASTVNCGDPQVVSVCFIPGPPALRYSLTVAKGEAFILPPKVCTTFEICGTKDCECIDLNDPRALDPKLRKAM